MTALNIYYYKTYLLLCSSNLLFLAKSCVEITHLNNNNKKRAGQSFSAYPSEKISFLW